MSVLGFPVIDSHCHIGYLPGRLGLVYTAADLKGVVEREGVAFALASSASSTTIGQSFGTDEAIAMVQQYPQHLGGMVWINPHDPRWQADAERVVQHHGFYGIKIHPSLDQYVVDFDSMKEVFAFAQRHHLPILNHAREGGTPYNFRALLEAFPDVKLLLAHFGPPMEGIKMTKTYENCFLETTYVPPTFVEIATDAIGSQKIVFGTDAPISFDVGGKEKPPEGGYLSYQRLVGDIIQTGLSQEDLENILYKNAARVFRINLADSYAFAKTNNRKEGEE